MKSIWNNTWFMIPALLFFNAGLLLTWFVPYGEEILLFNDLRREPFNSIFRFITYLGEVYPFVICGVAALFWRYRYALLIALTGLMTIPTVHVIKTKAGIDRPITWFRNRDMREAVTTVPGVDLNVGQTSFPSGHTMAAFGLYSMLPLLAGNKRRYWGLPFVLLAVLVGVSRVFLVQHFLADILVGAALGMVMSGLVWQMNRTQLLRRMTFLDQGLLPARHKMAVIAND